MRTTVRTAAELKAGKEPAVTLVDPPGAETLRDERVERVDGAEAHHHDREVQDRPSADRADRGRAQPPHHHVSTRPMLTQPISAAMTGSASRSIARNSPRT